MGKQIFKPNLLPLYSLAAVEKSRNHGPYDLILLDLDMPIMDGFEACKMLRSDKSGFGIKGLLHIDRNELMLPEEEHKEGYDVNHIESETVVVENRMLIIAISAYVDEDVT